MHEQREEMERQRRLVQAHSQKNAAEASDAPSQAERGRLTLSLKTPREGLPIVYRTSSPPHPLPPSTKSNWRPIAAADQLGNPALPASASFQAQGPVYAKHACPPMTKSIAKCSTFARQEKRQNEEKESNVSTKFSPRCAAPASAKLSSTVNTAAEKSGLESGSDSSVTQSAQSTDEASCEFATRARSADVLLGRGEDVSKHEGNILFQKLVMNRKREYLAAAASDRERLVLEISNDVHARRGRFLKRVEGSRGWWAPISSNAATKKIKQSFLYTYNTDTSPKDMTYYQTIAVKDISKYDVLLGRGRRTINHSGNIRLRELISSRKPQYTATSLHSDKDRIARDIKKAVEDRSGRFLEKLEGTEDAWVAVDEAVILKKIKLCFRYHHSETSGDQASVACHNSGAGASNASLLEAAKELAAIHRLTDRCSEVHMLTNDSNAISSGDHYQENGHDALLPPVLANAFVDSVMLPIHTADLRLDDVLLGR